MRKLLIIFTMITVLLSASALAENLSALTDEELLQLHQDVLDEMELRGLAGMEADSVPSDAVDSVLSFFSFWNSNDLDQMLALCESGWKAAAEDPRTELFRILANRTPLNMTVESAAPVAGEGPEGLSFCQVTVISTIDRNNGKSPNRYLFRILVREEADGIWRINPAGLNPSLEETEEAPPAETTPEPASSASGAAADPVLYYQPDGGEYYHLDPDCRRVHPKFLPLRETFLYSEITREPYCHLKPCAVCGAPAAPEAEDRPESGQTAPARFAASAASGFH